jgi:hypothetical protein
MRKSFVLTGVLLLILFLSPSLVASSLKFGISMNYYRVSDPIYRELYGKGNVLMGGLLGLEIGNWCEIRVEGSYFRDKGKMNLTEEEIIFTLTSPAILGIRIKFASQKAFNIYMGGGVDIYSYKERVPPRLENFSGRKAGFHIEGGSLIKLLHNFYLDLNIRYIKVDVNPLGELIKLGGIRTGIGFEYRL